jgi:hypothetical protein
MSDWEGRHNRLSTGDAFGRRLEFGAPLISDLAASTRQCEKPETYDCCARQSDDESSVELTAFGHLTPSHLVNPREP